MIPVSCYPSSPKSNMNHSLSFLGRPSSFSAWAKSREKKAVFAILPPFQYSELGDIKIPTPPNPEEG